MEFLHQTAEDKDQRVERLERRETETDGRASAKPT